MPTIYRSGDPGAPPMDGTPGAMVNVLDGCLVHGYGALATGVLTSDNNNVVAGDTVTIGSITYTFRASVTVLNDVQIGANADASLLNLINTINLTGSAGTTYMLAQSGHPEVYSVISVTAHAFMITAKRPGTLGNAVGTTETAASLSWGGTTLTGGSVSKASLGWTKDYSALARGIYRAPVASGGSRTYLEVIDNSPDVSNGSFNARVQGLETVSALGGGVLLSSGSGPFGHLVNASWAKSAALSWVQRPWMFIGDDRTFYLFVQAGQAANAYYCFAFGDHRSLVAGDTAKGFLLAHGAFATASSYSTSELTGVGGIAIQQGHYLQRNWSGVISNISWGKQGDGGWRGNPSAIFGAMTIPHAPDGGLYLSPMYIFEGVATAYTQRGILRGLYQVLHPTTSFNDGDTFAGVGDLAGRTFMIVKSLNNGGTPSGMYAVETTAWAA